MKDLILINCKMHSNSSSKPRDERTKGANGVAGNFGAGDEALVISGGKIAMITDFEQAREKYPHAKIKDLNGRTVLPGFVDSHIHMLQTGYLKVNLNLSQVKSIQRLKELIRQEAKGKTPGEWIIATSFDETNLVEKRVPTKEDLDGAAPFNPVFLIRVCTHLFVANSKALEMVGIGKDTPSPQGGIISKDSRGNPTGILKDNAADQVYDVINGDYEIQKESLRAALKEVTQAGITTVHDMAIGIKNINHYLKIMDMYREVLKEEGFPLRIVLGVEHYLLDDILKQGIEFLQGDDYFRQGYIKLFLDGSFGGRTALLKSKYKDEDEGGGGGGDGHGLLTMEESEIQAAVSKAAQQGFQCAVHALGDGALEKAFEQLAACNSTDLRHRIVHGGIADSDMIARIAANNIPVDFQPHFLASEVGWISDVLGEDQVKNLYRWKSMLEEGVHLAAGSDSPVEPVNPLLGVKSAVLRQTEELWPPGGFNPEECLTVEEMLKAYTYSGACQYFEEDYKGRIKPGYYADLVVLSEDPREVSAFELDRIEVEMSLVGGRIVYEKDDRSDYTSVFND